MMRLSVQDVAIVVTRTEFFSESQCNGAPESDLCSRAKVLFAGGGWSVVILLPFMIA